MSATNSTTNYNLPIFIASDSPKWLVDWNGAMNTIDSAINTVATAASGAAGDITSLQSDLQTLSGTVTTQGTSISTLTSSLSTLTGTVNTITSLIGNGEPTTTDKTIIGAINELHSDIQQIVVSVDADDVSYDNTTSGLLATNVQSAIDELAAGGGGASSADVLRLQNLTTLKGKKIAIVGDSLSVAGTWADEFENMLTGIATVDNKSVTAKTMNWLHDDGWSTILGSTDYDIIIIALGINNWSLATPIGEFSASPVANTSFDDALVNGYKDLITYYGTDKCPEIYYITPFPISYSNPANTLKYTPDVYRKCIATFAKVVGARFINGDCAPIVSNALSKVPTDIYQTDGIHFTTNYKKILADFIISKVLSGGDCTVSDSDGIEIDLSSYKTSKFNGTIKGMIDGHSLKLVIRGSVTDTFTTAGSVIASFNADVAKVIKNTTAAIEILPIGVYGVNASAPNPAIPVSAYFISGTDLAVNLGSYAGSSANIAIDIEARSPSVYMRSNYITA